MSGPSQQPGEMPPTQVDAAEADPTLDTDYPDAQADVPQSAADPVFSPGSEGGAAPAVEDPDGLPPSDGTDDAGRDVAEQRLDDEQQLRAQDLPSAVVDDVLGG